DGVARGVPVVQNTAEPGLPLVGGDDVALDAAALGDHRDQDIRVAAEQRLEAAAHAVEQSAARRHAVLDDLVEARAELAAWQRDEDLRIDHDVARLVKRADQVLAGRVVYADLSPDCAIHLG